MRYMGADIITITEGKIQQKAIGKLFGVEPEMRIDGSFVTLYYPPDKLKMAQQTFSNLMGKQQTGDVRYSFEQVPLPWVIKTFALYVLGLLAVGWFIGRSN